MGLCRQSPIVNTSLERVIIVSFFHIIALLPTPSFYEFVLLDENHLNQLNTLYLSIPSDTESERIYLCLVFLFARVGRPSLFYLHYETTLVCFLSRLRAGFHFLDCATR